MARIDGVFNNFANHITSGLSQFTLAAYDACERAQASVLVLRLFPTVEVSEIFAADDELAVTARALREKFVEILQKQSALPLDQVASLVVETDFLPDEGRVQARRRMLAAIPVYYGYDPVYRCTVSLRLASGSERIVTMQDRSSTAAEPIAAADAKGAGLSA